MREPSSLKVGDLVAVKSAKGFPGREIRCGGVERGVFPDEEWTDSLEHGFDVLPGTLGLIRGFSKIDKAMCPIVWVPSSEKMGWFWPYEVEIVSEAT